MSAQHTDRYRMHDDTFRQRQAPYKRGNSWRNALKKAASLSLKIEQEAWLHAFAPTIHRIVDLLQLKCHTSGYRRNILSTSLYGIEASVPEHFWNRESCSRSWLTVEFESHVLKHSCRSWERPRSSLGRFPVLLHAAACGALSMHDCCF